MQKIKLLLLLLLGFISTAGFSQTKISGTVLAENETPLSRATVSLKGSRQSTTTDDKGRFSLTGVSKNNILVISFVGYETQSVSV